MSRYREGDMMMVDIREYALLVTLRKLGLVEMYGSGYMSVNVECEDTMFFVKVRRIGGGDEQQ